MSLEQALAEHASVMRDLIKALESKATTVVQEVKTEVKKAANKVAEKVESVAASAPAETEVEAAPAAEQPSYDEVAKAITDLAKNKGRDAALAVFKAFGVTKLPEAKPEQYADILAAALAA